MENFPQAGAREEKQANCGHRERIDQPEWILWFWRVLGIRLCFIDAVRQFLIFGAL
jgi:hypothetical protein